LNDFWKTKIRRAYQGPAILTLWFFVNSFGNVGCAGKTINPPIEHRVFFPTDWACSATVEGALSCQMPEGMDIDKFVFMGKARYLEDKAFNRQCIDLLEELH